MRVLFVSNHFPGVLGPLAAILAADPANEVLYASLRQRKDFEIGNVRRIHLKKRYNGPWQGQTNCPDVWNSLIKNGENALHAFHLVRDTWKNPDIVFASLASGAGFFVPEIFPDAFVAAYAETEQKNFWLGHKNMRYGNILAQSALFMQSGVCYAFSDGQKKLFPEHLRPAIQLIEPFVDTDFFAPKVEKSLAPGSLASLKVVLMLATGLGSAALREILDLSFSLLSEKKDCGVAILTENASLREELTLAAKNHPGEGGNRLLVLNGMPISDYRNLLLSADMAVKPPSPNPVPRDMLECMSCGTPVMVGNGVIPPLMVEKDCLLLPRKKGQALKKAILDYIDNPAERKRISEKGRALAISSFNQKKVLPAHLASVMRARQLWHQKRLAGEEILNPVAV